MPRSIRVSFDSQHGPRLAAILELPEIDGGGFAVFAHCFTCSKDSLAAARISRALAERGVGVLRLDFTGLGDSEGRFADSNFSTNLADLHAAAEFLRAEYGPLRLLIGHSLGGAAALAVAGAIEGLRAVVSIAAPSEPAHVGRLIEQRHPEIVHEGEAMVNLGGRAFCIKRQFIEDLLRHDLLADVRAMRRALLLLHSPSDTIVGIEHVARLIEAWSSRYLRGPGGGEP